MNEDWLAGLVRGATSILDAGCGPTGSWWWAHVRPETSLVAVDLFFEPPELPRGARFLRADLAAFCRDEAYRGAFDLIVADHVLEHVTDMAAVCRGLQRLLRKGGSVHVGVPDATMFTDRFYHLIHPEGGGHVSKPTLDEVTALMADAGLVRVDHRPWPDDWRWLQESYDWRGRGVQYFAQADLDHIVDVFRRELTPEKGYYYGWEIVFRKDDDREPPASTAMTTVEVPAVVPPSPAPAVTLTEEEHAELRHLLELFRRVRSSWLFPVLRALSRGLRLGIARAAAGRGPGPVGGRGSIPP